MKSKVAEQYLKYCLSTSVYRLTEFNFKFLVVVLLLGFTCSSYAVTTYAVNFYQPRFSSPLALCQNEWDAVYEGTSTTAVFAGWDQPNSVNYPTEYNCLYELYTGEIANFLTFYSYEDQSCAVIGPNYIDDGTGQCIEQIVKFDAKQPTNSCSDTKGPNPQAGDPIIVATGNSFQTEVDYRSKYSSGLSFIRHYNSSAFAIDNGIGQKWQHDFQRYVTKIDDTQVLVARSNNQTFAFKYDSPSGSWLGDVDISDTLVELRDVNDVRTGWVYTDSNDTIENYDATGQLLTITNRAGQSQYFVYNVAAIDGGDDNASTLDKVTGAYGEVMIFSYDASGRIATMTDPHGRVYQYGYDAIGNLSSVTYPIDNGSAPSRFYHYEDVNFPNNLTGITDENGNRFVTWSYDAQGRAISSEHAGGVDNFTLTFNTDDNVTVTNPLGKQTTYDFITLHDVKKVSTVTGHPTASCAGANKAYTYDANGYLATKTDWKGNVTTYVHDNRGRELSRTEADGTPEARTITTDWHAQFRLPIRITEPDKVTEYDYDGQGRLISTTVIDVP